MGREVFSGAPLRVLVAACAWLAVGAAGASAEVGPLVSVSAGSPFHRTCAKHAARGYLVEPTATAVTGSQTLVAAWQTDRARLGADAIQAATSTDGGATWSTTVVRGLSRCSGGTASAVSDPWLSGGADGVLYLAAVEIKYRHRIPSGSVAIARSLDAGRSWHRSVVFHVRHGRFDDKPTVTADPTRPGVAYATWNVVRGPRREVVVSRTLDAGVSWSRPRVVAKRGGFAQIVVSPTGSLTLVYTKTATSPHFKIRFQHIVRTSSDVGVTWSPPVVIDRQRSVFAPSSRVPLAVVRASPDLYSLTAGPNGIYLASAVIDSFARSHIVLVHQPLDGSWSSPATIADGSTIMFLPTVAENPSGRIAVTWDSISSINGQEGIPTTVTAAVSDDQGSSWTTSTLREPFDLQHIRIDDSELFLGDYQGLTGTPAGFNAVYITAVGEGHTKRTMVVSQAFG